MHIVSAETLVLNRGRAKTLGEEGKQRDTKTLHYSNLICRNIVWHSQEQRYLLREQT